MRVCNYNIYNMDKKQGGFNSTVSVNLNVHISINEYNFRLPDADMDFDDEATAHEPKTNGANNAGNNINLASMA